MKCHRLLGLLPACLLLSMSLFAKDISVKNRVIGADRVKMDAHPKELMIMLTDLPFNQGEIDLFLNSLDPIEAWANEHREEWNRAHKVKNPIPTVFALDVWKSTDVDAAEFIALIIKFTVAKEVLSGSLDVKELKETKELLEGMFSDMNLSEQSKSDTKESVNMIQQFIEALNNYPAENKRLFEQNRKKLEEGLARVNLFGKPSEQEAAEKPAPKSVSTATAPSWANQKIKVSGTAVIDEQKHQSRGRAMLWARRAATFNARDNLLESVSDLRLDSQTTIRDVLTKDDLDDLDVFNGIIRKHYQVGSDSSDITYTVIMEIKMNDVYSYMKEKGIYYK